MRSFIPSESIVEFGFTYFSNKISKKKFVEAFGYGRPFELRTVNFLISSYPVTKSFVCEDGNEYMIAFKKGARNFSKITCLIQEPFLDTRKITHQNENEWAEIASVNKKQAKFYFHEFHEWLISKGCEHN